VAETVGAGLGVLVPSNNSPGITPPQPLRPPAPTFSRPSLSAAQPFRGSAFPRPSLAPALAPPGPLLSAAPPWPGLSAGQPFRGPAPPSPPPRPLRGPASPRSRPRVQALRDPRQLVVIRARTSLSTGQSTAASARWRWCEPWCRCVRWCDLLRDYPGGYGLAGAVCALWTPKLTHKPESSPVNAYLPELGVGYWLKWVNGTGGARRGAHSADGSPHIKGICSPLRFSNTQ